MAGSGRDELFRQQHGSRCCERRGGRLGAFSRCVKLTNGIEKSKVLHKRRIPLDGMECGTAMFKITLPPFFGTMG